MAEGEPKLAILASNHHELEQLGRGLEWLDAIDCPYAVLAQSIWSDPECVIEWTRDMEESGVRALLVVAGREPQAAGLAAAACNLPVIAIALSPGAARMALATSAAAPVVVTRVDGGGHAVALGLRIVAAAEPEWLSALEQYRVLAAENETAPQPIKTGPRGEPSPVIPIPTQSAGTRQAPNMTEDDEPPTHIIGMSSEIFTTQPPRERGTIGTGPQPAESGVVGPDDEPIEVRPFDFSRPLQGDRVFPLHGRDSEPSPVPRTPPPARQLGRCPVDSDSPEVDLIEDAVDCLLEGGIIAFPTETVYGLAVDATNAEAVERLFALKGRPRNKAISLMVDQPRLLAAIARNLTIEVRRLMEAFWPGPLTLILEKRPGNFDHLTDGNTIGVRLPDHPVPLALIQALARPLACTSANLAGEPEATSADEIEETFGDGINMILDGGQIPEKQPSTVLDVTQEPFRILRLGALGYEQLSAILGEKLEMEN